MTEVPERIGRYTVAGRLGSGGMGEVFLAYSPAGDPVAVKVIRADRLDQQTRTRFEQEAFKASTIVGTQRVARFLEAEPFARQPWMAMEYVPGPTLDRFVNAAGVLKPLLVASLGALVAESLAAVHAVGLLHRDFKPGNLILGESGPVLIDFGLAAFADVASSLSHPGMTIGTPVTMPPEQANGVTRVTTAADVYGLGTVLLYAAAGHYPYAGVSRDVIISRVGSPDVAPDLSGTPEQLMPLIAALLAHDAADRPTLDDVAQTCMALVAERGGTMAQARRALLAHLDSHTLSTDGPEDSAVAELEDSFEAWASLQARLAAEGVESADAEEMVSLTETDRSIESSRPLEPAGPPKPDRSAKPSASQRVAEELRAVYAASPSL